MLSKFSFMWGIFFCLKKSYKKILVLVYVLVYYFLWGWKWGVNGKDIFIGINN